MPTGRGREFDLCAHIGVQTEMSAPETNTARVLGRLAREGWQLARHGGSHDVYRHPQKPGSIVVPRHRTLSPGVARNIARIAGWG